jgi:hypothetical protein
MADRQSLGRRLPHAEVLPLLRPSRTATSPTTAIGGGAAVIKATSEKWKELTGSHSKLPATIYRLIEG